MVQLEIVVQKLYISGKKYGFNSILLVLYLSQQQRHLKRKCGVFSTIFQTRHLRVTYLFAFLCILICQMYETKMGNKFNVEN